MKYIIYQHINPISNKSYIGFTKESIELRWQQHKRASKNGSNYKFHQAIRKYPENIWQHKILGEVTTLNEAKKLECDFILKFDSFKKKSPMFEETKKKISESNLGKIPWNKGKKKE